VLFYAVDLVGGRYYLLLNAGLGVSVTAMEKSKTGKAFKKKMGGLKRMI